jgi:hypothetical protein
MTNTHFKTFALAAVAAALAAPAFATPTTIQNTSVLAGVSDHGTLGSNGNTSPGILYDSTGSSNYGINDFLTPGTPWEGFYITGAGGFSEYSNNTDASGYHGGTTFASLSPTSLTATSAIWTGTSLDGSMTVSNTYTLTTVGGRSAISISTVLTNNTAGALTDLQFLRSLDPDPDVNAFGSYSTNNSVISNDQACGTGPASGQTICIFTDSSFEHKAGVSGGGHGTSLWTTSPADYLGGLNDGNGDYAIGIGFALGSLGAGQSLTVNYGYALGGSLDVAITPSVPEPETYALMTLGLAAMGFVSRRRRPNA